MHLFWLTIIIIFYIVISNFLTLDVEIQNIVDKFKYSNYVMIFILAFITLYIQNPNLKLLNYFGLSLGVTIFFYFFPFVRLNKLNKYK